MARKRRDKSPSGIELKHPDRSGPTEKTLLQLAEERKLFEQAKKRQDAIRKKQAKDADGGDGGDDGPGLPPAVERVLETLLWSVSLSMLHFTLDVLVQHQYSVDKVVWSKVCLRTSQALLGKLDIYSLPVLPLLLPLGVLLLTAPPSPVFSMLVYVFHRHPSNPSLLPGLPQRFQSPLRQAIFFASSIGAGCYLVHITNTFGYLAVMKQAPPIGCLWVWSVIELELPWAVLSLAATGAFLWQKGYSIK